MRWRSPGAGVAGAHPGPDIDVGLAAPRELGADAGERRLEVALDVVGQGLERRDVDDLRLVPEPALDALAHQIVDRRHERGQASCPDPVGAAISVWRPALISGQASACAAVAAAKLVSNHAATAG